MDSTITTGELEQSASLAEVMGDFACGALSLREINEILCRELRDDRSRGADIQSLLEKELKARRLSVKDYKELVEGINASLRSPSVAEPEEDIPSENVPTETSVESPKEPGRYLVDQEGTLVLDEDDEELRDIAKPTEAYDSLIEPGPVIPDGGVKAEAVKAVPAIGEGSILRERFRLDEEIARGSMGIVYRATDLLKQEAGAKSPFVAVKLISPEFVSHGAALKTFQNEIANTQHLSHPNIIHLFELDRDGEHYFITMEWLEGESLDALLDRSRGSALPPTQTYAIIEQLCDALAYAHQREVIHADVKPGNVFLVKTGELKLIDFGIAQIASSDSDVSQRSDTVALTPAYASCERLEKAPPTAQDDLFSLACMIYRLLSGRRVFGALNALEAEQAGVEPVPIGGMSEARWEALGRALAYRRVDRQATVAEFAGRFGQRRNPRDMEASEEEVAFTDTMMLEELPEEVIISDTARLEAIAATTRMEALGESSGVAALAGTVDHMHIDTTGMESLNETAELRTLAGANEIRNTVVAPDQAKGQSAQSPPLSDLDKALFTGSDTTHLEELNEAAYLTSLGGVGAESVPQSQPAEPQLKAANNSMHVDTARLEAMPDIGLVSDVDEVTEAQPVAPGQETPFVDTVNLDGETMPEPVNIFDGDGSGFAPLAEPAVAMPADDIAAPPAPRVRKAPVSPAPDSSVGPTRHQEKVKAQLSGRAQHQVARQTGLVALIRKPAVAAGGLLGVIACMIAAGVMLSDAEPEPAITAAASRAPAAPSSQPSAGALLRADQPVVMDLTTPVEPVAQNQPAGSMGADIDLAAPVESAAAAPVPVKPLNLSTPAAVEAELATAADVTEDAVASEGVVVKAPLPEDSLAALVVAAPLAETAASNSAPVVVPARDIPFAEPAPVAPKPNLGRAQFLQDLQSNATAALKDDRLVAPENDSAAYWLAQMRAEDAPAAEVEKVAAGLSGRLTKRAEKAYIDGDIAAAARWADVAESNGASELELAPVRVSVRKFTGANPSPAAAAGPPVSDQVEVNQAAAKVFPTVALSDLEFVKYVEPRYPTSGGADVAGGWVDVMFTVDKGGETQNAVVTDSDLPERFEAPSLNAVKRWRFEPYAPEGRPLVVNTAIRLRYDN